MRHSKEGVVRRNIAMSGPTHRRLEALRSRIDASSHTDVIRYALWCLEQVLDEEDRGNEFLVRSRTAANGELMAYRWGIPRPTGTQMQVA